MSNDFNEEKAKNELEKGYGLAREIVNDRDKFERFLQRLEMKLKTIPKIGDKLADVPILASMLNSFFKHEYTDIPIGTIIAIISALIYFVSPVDAIPDLIPGFGYVDDAAVITVCLLLIESDVKEYVRWREVNGKEISI